MVVVVITNTAAMNSVDSAEPSAAVRVLPGVAVSSINRTSIALLHMRMVMSLVDAPTNRSQQQS